MGYKSGYKFTSETFEVLVQLIQNMPVTKNEKNRRTLLMDECFINIDAMKVIEFISLTSGKLNIRYTDEYRKQLENQLNINIDM